MASLFAPVGLTPSASASAALSSLQLRAPSSSPRPSASPPPSGGSGGSAGYYSSGGGYRHSTALTSLGLSSVSKHGKGGKSAPLLLELGEAYVRAGFAGEQVPRHILHTRTMLATLRPRMATPGACMEDAAGTHTLSPSQLYEASLELSQSRLFLANPWHTPAHWGPLLLAILRHIYFHVLCVNPRDRRLILVEALGWSQGFKRALVRAVCKLEVPALVMVRGSEAAMYCSMPLLRPMPSMGGGAPSASAPSASASTALLLDIGWSETRLLPVHLGVPLHHLMVCTPLGMWDVHRKLAEMLRPLLRMEYAQLGGDVESAYYLSEESKLLAPSSLERLLAQHGYVQPFALALEGFKSERQERMLLSPRSKAALTASFKPEPSLQVQLPAPVPPIPSSTAAMDLPAPLPFPWYLHAAPPLGTPLPGDEGAPPADVAFPPLVTLPPSVRYEAFETLFEFDRCAASQAAATRAGEVTVAGSESSPTDVGNARGSHCEKGLAAALVDLLISPLGGSSPAASSALRVGLVSNIIVMGGGGMVAGLAERVVDECNWMLGSAYVPGRDGRARAEAIVQAGLQGVQNRLALNPCSSALSIAPAAPAPPSFVLPPAPGPLPTSPPVAAPACPAPFASNLLAWTGSSILGSIDLADDEWMSHAELAQFVGSEGKRVSQAELAQRAQAVEAHKRAIRGQKEKVVVPLPPTVLEAMGVEGKDVVADPSASPSAAASAMTTLRPMALPDWANPDSDRAIAQARTAAVAAAAGSIGASGSSSFLRGSSGGSGAIAASGGLGLSHSHSLSALRPPLQLPGSAALVYSPMASAVPATGSLATSPKPSPAAQQQQGSAPSSPAPVSLRPVSGEELPLPVASPKP